MLILFHQQWRNKRTLEIIKLIFLMIHKNSWEKYGEYGHHCYAYSICNFFSYFYVDTCYVNYDFYWLI